MTQHDLTHRLITLAESKYGKKIAVDDDFFAALGIDSMQALELLSEIERTFDVEIPDWELAGVSTIAGLAEVVKRRAA
jgi:acyl carrier protein